jgi:2,4-dienoyl-CoA reductase-like NADH-dependent reductase (Old Yellow Enzyme family)
MKTDIVRIARLKTNEAFLSRLDELGIDLPFDGEMIVGAHSPLAQAFKLKSGFKIGNRFCVHPMEGWDGTIDGNPTDLVFRRWRNFGRSGAKLIWGGEAFAVRPEGRANPNQLMILDHTMKQIEELKNALIQEHRSEFGDTEELLVGMQLTHSGRFCRPNQKSKLEPKIVYHHPVLDEIFNISADYPVITDAEIDDLIGDYVRAAKRAQTIGFNFVDIKHCHGYLGHELLSAVDRSGNYGGSFENRTKFLREIVRGIQAECPGLIIGVRFSSFDLPPFRADENNIGQMIEYRDENGRYPYAFGGDPENLGEIKLDEPIALMKLMNEIGVELVNFSASSPYYSPHLIRPALYPPSDGYLPPEDPLVGVARQIRVAEILSAAAPELACVGSAYSYLQEYIPNVAQAAVRLHKIDFVGLGRSALSYPELPADVLNGRPLKRKKICRTFSDCTTAPRKGLVSGCYPLDEFYKQRPEAEQLKLIKKNK